MGDWDRKPKENPSVYLRLKTKGEAVKFRIAAAPLRELTVWPSSEIGAKPLKDETVQEFTPGQWMRLMVSPDWEIREGYVLRVIDRMDGLAKLFRISSSVYGKIRDYAQNSEWGSPTQYDITVTRTEAPGKAYWDVTPSPNKSGVTQAEIDRIAALDIHKLVPMALPTDAAQPDELDDDTEQEDLPWEQHLPAVSSIKVPPAEKREKVDYEARIAEAKARNAAATQQEDTGPTGPTDDVIADVPDSPINLDDIPF